MSKKQKLIAAFVLASGLIAAGFNACSNAKFVEVPIVVDPMTTALKVGQHENTFSVDTSKLDILLVVDNSSSMLTDNLKLAARLGGFIDNLQNSKVDWQMCATTTSFIMPSDSYPKVGTSTV